MNFEISQEEAKNLMQKIIQIRSDNPPADSDECAKFIASWFNENNIQSSVYKCGYVSNVIAEIGGEQKKSLLWNGHYDTVPAGEDEFWDDNPFSGKYENGFVYGRGAGDMKSGLVSMMLAMKAIKNSGVKL